MQVQDLPICCVCSQPTEQILLLRCSHNPCINCAMQLTNRGSNLECECPICNMKTRLEPSTISELKKLKKQVSHSKSHSVLDYHSNFKKVVRLTNTEANRSVQVTESEAKDEAFCFGCWKLVSLEHLMLDSHRNHEVKMVSKGFTKLKVILEDKEEALQRKQDKLSRAIIDIEHQKMQWQQGLGFKKREIVQACSKLKTAVEHIQEKAILNLYDSHRGYLKNLDDQLRKLKSRTCEADLLKNQIMELNYKITKTDKTAFEDIPKLNLQIESQLNIPLEPKVTSQPNINQFSINAQALSNLIRRLNNFQMFGKPSSVYKTLEESQQMSTDLRDTRQNNFFDQLKTKIFNQKNNSSFDDIKTRITLKTTSNDKHRQTVGSRSILTDRKKNLNFSEEPLQITKNKLKRQLGQSNGSLTQRNKQNFRIVL